MATGSEFNNPANSVNLNVTGQVDSHNECHNCINVPPTGDDGSTNCFEATAIEQLNSGKYVSVKNVATRLARNARNKNFDIYDIAEWAGECEVEEIGQYEGFAKYRNVEITVKNNKAYLPCNIYRILSVYRNRCSVSTYDWDGVYLRFNFDDPRTFHREYKIQLDYLGVMVDDEGLPMILDGHQEACYWYIMTKLYFEDFMNGLIDQNRYIFLQDRLGHYVAKAKSSMRHYSRDDMNDVQAILHNMVPKVRMSRNIA